MYFGSEAQQGLQSRTDHLWSLLKSNPELRPVLRKGGFLTRDARVKERKKPGLKRARKAPQYTKR